MSQPPVTASTAIVTSQLQHLPCKWSLHSPALLPGGEARRAKSSQILLWFLILNNFIIQPSKYSSSFNSGCIYTGLCSPLDTFSSPLEFSLEMSFKISPDILFVTSAESTGERLFLAFPIRANQTHPLPICKKRILIRETFCNKGFSVR